MQHLFTCRYDVFPDIVPVADYGDFGRQQLSNAHVPPSPMLRSGMYQTVRMLHFTCACYVG